MNFWLFVSCIKFVLIVSFDSITNGVCLLRIGGDEIEVLMAENAYLHA